MSLAPKVSYEVRGSPKAMYYCHCGMCRKATGSSFATNMLVREADFVVVSGRRSTQKQKKAGASGRTKLVRVVR